MIYKFNLFNYLVSYHIRNRYKIKRISRVGTYDKIIPSGYTDKIEVDLDKCIIKQGDFYFNLRDPGFITTLGQDENKNQFNRKISVAIYRQPLTDNQFEEYVSSPSFKDEITLSFLFDKQKKTYILYGP